MYILSLEASTTSAKAMLYDTQGKTFKVKTERYSISGDPAQSNAEKVYSHLLSVGRALAAKEQISAISLSGTWHSVALFEKNMHSVSPMYLWSYKGASELCKKLREDPLYVRNYYQRTGCMVNAIYPFFKLLLMKESYDLSQLCIMGQGTYINYKMTGNFVTTECMASGSGLMNIHSRQYDEQLLKELGIERNQLAEIVASDSSFPLVKEAARELGLEPGIPVILTNSDGGLNQIGAGASAKGIMTMSVGTSGALRVTADRPFLPENKSTWCYLSPAGYLSGAAVNGGCNCIDWIKDGMFDEQTSYAQIEAKSRPQENTPVFLPFLYGERSPGWDDERCGEFCLLRSEHNRYDMYRAVQEGVLFSMFQCYETICALNGEPDKICFSGGILNSEVWSQMCADIFQKPLEVNDSEHMSMVGAVVLAMKELGLINEVKEYQPMPVKVIEPYKEKAAYYKRKYERYLNCYKRVMIK